MLYGGQEPMQRLPLCFWNQEWHVYYNGSKAMQMQRVFKVSVASMWFVFGDTPIPHIKIVVVGCRSSTVVCKKTKANFSTTNLQYACFVYDSDSLLFVKCRAYSFSWHNWYSHNVERLWKLHYTYTCQTTNTQLLLHVIPLLFII